MNKSYYLANYKKFAELLVYTLSKFETEVNETKLLKLLYFADAKNFEKNDTTISANVTYYKNHFGPTPNYKILTNIYNALAEYIQKEETNNDGYKSCKLKLSKGNYVFKTLTADELEVVDEVVKHYGGLTLADVVRLSHLDPPYLASEKQKKIDFSFVKFRKSDEDYESHLDESVQQKIAADITIDSRRKLKVYAEANS